MDYTEVRFYNDASLNEVIIAWLGENDYDMFDERTDGLNAYIVSNRFDENNLINALSAIPEAKEKIRYEIVKIQDQNWNTKWESNFEPVVVAEKVFIRAPFHKTDDRFPFEIIIEPKMSFGTGHHETTALMIEYILQTDLAGKKILDMGCGTGILAILAEKCGAAGVTAIDVEEWAFNNSLENCEINKATKVLVLQGDTRLIKEKYFDVILANINRNILLSDIPEYSSCLNPDGVLIVSGILEDDKEVINRKAQENGLLFNSIKIKNKWIAISFKKK